MNNNNTKTHNHGGIELPEEIVQHIKEEARRIHHGQITIELNATSGKIDVVSGSRERFPVMKSKKSGI